MTDVQELVLSIVCVQGQVVEPYNATASTSSSTVDYCTPHDSKSHKNSRSQKTAGPKSKFCDSETNIQLSVPPSAAKHGTARNNNEDHPPLHDNDLPLLSLVHHPPLPLVVHRPNKPTSHDYLFTRPNKLYLTQLTTPFICSMDIFKSKSNSSLVPLPVMKVGFSALQAPELQQRNE